MTIIKKIVLISHVLIMGLVCCSNDPISSRNENKGGSVSINLVATSGSIFSSLARSSEAKVTAVGMDTIRQSLTVSSNSITGLISNIPAGFNRKFEVFVYDSLGRICYYGSAYSNIINGSTVNVPLTLYRYTGTGNAVIDGSIIDSIPSNPNQSPSVTITSPANNATFLQGDTILINATATDSDGIIRNVTFYNDSILLATDTIAPYGYTLRNISSGTYRFRAVALDSNGAADTSSIITVTVTAINKTPVVSITSPANNATFRQGDSIQINATATDSDGIIRNVTFYNDSILLATDTIAPYGYTLRNISSGTYRFRAVALDSNGAADTSSIITVTVTVINKTPVVSITSPANNATFRQGDSIQINATATDSDGIIRNVTLYNDSILLATDTIAPYGYTLHNVSSGTYRFRAVALDSNGATDTSSIITVTVTAINKTPVVSITSPANNATFRQGDSIQINATATDSDGIIRNVTFYNDSILLATDTIAPYGYTLRNISSGTYRFRAVALDSNGATGTSSIITVSVTATSALLTGTTFGTSPSWSTGSEYDKAFDKNTATFFDFSSADTGYTGLDLSSPKTTNKIRYYPRANFANRMVGGKFQGSNTSRTSGYVDLLTISIQPTAGAWTEATISDTTKYRYIRYKSPNGGFGNIAEIEIWGY